MEWNSTTTPEERKLSWRDVWWWIPRNVLRHSACLFVIVDRGIVGLSCRIILQLLQRNYIVLNVNKKNITPSLFVDVTLSWNFNETAVVSRDPLREGLLTMRWQSLVVYSLSFADCHMQLARVSDAKFGVSSILSVRGIIEALSSGRTKGCDLLWSKFFRLIFTARRVCGRKMSVCPSVWMSVTRRYSV